MKMKYIFLANGKNLTITPRPNTKTIQLISNEPLRIYVSGSITGDIKLGLNWRKKFRAYERFLKEFYPNATFYNPGNEVPGAELKPERPVKDLTEWQYNTVMKRDLTNLLECDAIAFIPDWRESKGAKCERKVAECIGLKMITLPRIHF